MVYRFPYTKISTPRDRFPRFKYHPLITIGIVNTGLVRVEAYIDTGAQFCLFNNEIAKQLGINDYKATKDRVLMVGIGGTKPENVAYFHDLKLVVFKSNKKFKVNERDAWIIDTKIGFLEKPIGFAGILGVYGFLDHFRFTTNIPEGYFEIDPLWET